MITDQHQTRELPIKVLGYKQHLFQIGLRREEHSLPLSLCLYRRSRTNYQVFLLSPRVSHLISLRLYFASSLEFYMPLDYYGPKRKEFILCKKTQYSIGVHARLCLVPLLSHAMLPCSLQSQVSTQTTKSLVFLTGFHNLVLIMPVSTK